MNLFAQVVLPNQCIYFLKSFAFFNSLFGTKCAKCLQNFNKNDFVMRARNKIYHIDCFRCVACSRQLVPGDEFALREDGLFCKEDHEIVEKATATAQATHARVNSNPRSTPSGGKLFSFESTMR